MRSSVDKLNLSVSKYYLENIGQKIIESKVIFHFVSLGGEILLSNIPDTPLLKQHACWLLAGVALGFCIPRLG